jgi:hypothetical protein
MRNLERVHLAAALCRQDAVQHGLTTLWAWLSYYLICSFKSFTQVI